MAWPRSLLLAAAASVSLCSAALAEYPERPVTLVVPYPPGGTTDILARILADNLGKSLGQNVVVENKPGAGGAIGSGLVAQAEPDGYTLVLGTINSHGINVSLFADLPYDPVTDFVAISNVAITPNVLIANKDVAVEGLADVIEMAKAEPGQHSFGSTSPGGSPHMSGELLKMMADIDLVHVPYQGGGPMLTDLIGGQIEFGFDNLPSSMGHIRSGDVRAVAVTTAERWPGAPDIPTVAESGLPEYEVSAWFGLFAPTGTPEEIVNRLYEEVHAIVEDEAINKRLIELGADPIGDTPQEFAATVAAEVEKWKSVVAESGLKIQ